MIQCSGTRASVLPDAHAHAHAVIFFPPRPTSEMYNQVDSTAHSDPVATLHPRFEHRNGSTAGGLAVDVSLQQDEMHVPIPEAQMIGARALRMWESFTTREPKKSEQEGP